MAQTCLGSRLHYRLGCPLRYWVALKRRSGSMCFCASPLGLAGFAAIRGLRCFGWRLVSALIVPSKPNPSTGLHSDCCAGLNEQLQSEP
jgi:hypothetical protein